MPTDNTNIDIYLHIQSILMSKVYIQNTKIIKTSQLPLFSLVSLFSVDDPEGEPSRELSRDVLLWQL